MTTPNSWKEKKMSKEEILKYAAEAIEKQIPKKPNVSAYNEDGSLNRLERMK